MKREIGAPFLHHSRNRQIKNFKGKVKVGQLEASNVRSNGNISPQKQRGTQQEGNSLEDLREKMEVRAVNKRQLNIANQTKNVDQKQN